MPGRPALEGVLAVAARHYSVDVCVLSEPTELVLDKRENYVIRQQANVCFMGIIVLIAGGFGRVSEGAGGLR